MHHDVIDILAQSVCCWLSGCWQVKGVSEGPQLIS